MFCGPSTVDDPRLLMFPSASPRETSFRVHKKYCFPRSQSISVTAFPRSQSMRILLYTKSQEETKK